MFRDWLFKNRAWVYWFLFSVVLGGSWTFYGIFVGSVVFLIVGLVFAVFGVWVWCRYV